jgi:hypothetical protein
MSACGKCGHDVQIGEWPLCPHGRVVEHRPAVHARERAVKFYHPGLNAWRTPGEANRLMPERLQQLGFERVEFSSLRELQQHERSTGSRAEVIDYNKNSHLAERSYGKTS